MCILGVPCVPENEERSDGGRFKAANGTGESQAVLIGIVIFAALFIAGNTRRIMSS
jgi:hypothetical protein